MVTKTRPYNPDLKRDKLEQAILFFLHHAQNAYLGRTKLMKLLYFADFDHFERNDDSITGARYYKLPYGPVPTEVEDIISEMVTAGRIRCAALDAGIYTQKRCEPIEAVNPFAFTGPERKTLEQVAMKWRDANAKDISAASHDEAPWNAVKNNELIPYYLAYYRNTYGELDMNDEFLEADERASCEE